ncbi:MAG TPA: AAA family ATPase [Thermoanaerobaculia bacterium]|nr:AAA family ATPase [Thermoanaerobaculia bacterium]
MQTLYFGAFELDVAAGELRRRGRVVPLGPQPLKLLILLATRAGEVVPRDAIERELWPDGIHVDVEHGINTSISQIRRALGDRAGRPRFVETLPRRGYRFIPGVSRGGHQAAPRPRGRMIGRDDILRRLEEDYRRVASQHRGQVICVAGEPGIGKTTLGDVFVAALRSKADPKPFIGRGRCSERLAGTEAYLPWLEAFESLLEDDLAGDVDRLMRSAAPSWYVQVVRSPAPAGEAHPLRLASLSQEQMKRELVAFLSGLSALRPVLIWFEDLHWADASTVDLIAYVGGRLDGLTLLLLTTYRQTELLMAGHPFTAVRLDLEGRGLCREMPLPFLGRGDVSHYLDLEFPGHDFPPALGDLLHGRSEGSPLFIVDSAQYLRTKGSIVRSGAGWTLRGSLPDLAHELPQSIRSVIERKLSLLEGTTTRLLQAAAVQGYDFDSTIAADASGMDALDAEARLDELARIHHLVTPTGERRLPDGAPTQAYRFVHVLYQNVLYAQLTPTRRARDSIAVAGALLNRHTGRATGIASSLARLFEAGGDARRAGDYFLMAARQAAGVFANHEVVALVECGLRLLPQLEDPDERDRRELELRMAMGPSLMALQGMSASAVGDNFARAKTLCERFDDAGELAIPLQGLMVFHSVRAEFDEACRLAERLGRLVEAFDDPTVRLRPHGDLGANYFLMGRLREARSRLTTCLELYLRDRSTHHDRLVLMTGMDAPAIVAAYIAYTDAVEGWPERAQQRLDVAFTYGQSHPFTEALLLAFACMVPFTLNDPATVRMRAHELVALSEEHGFEGQAAFGSFFLGWAQAEQGDEDAGLARMTDAKKRLRELGNDIYSSLRQVGLAGVLRRQGRLTEALAAVESGEAFVARSGERVFHSELLRLRGLIALDGGDRAAAERALRQALDVARAQGARLFELRAATALAEGCGSECGEFRDALERVYSSFREGLDCPDLQRARAVLDLRT